MIFGHHAVKAALQNHPENVRVLHVQKGKEDAYKELMELARSQGISVEVIARQKLDEALEGAAHNGIAATAGSVRNYDEMDIKDLIDRHDRPALILVLDGVQDPHNLGACLRSANAAGADMVIIPKDKAAGMTPVVQKVASGAAEITPLVTVTNLARTLDQLKDMGVWMYGAAEEAEESIYSMDLKGSVALVMGAEGSGLRRLTQERCDYLIRIPMSGTVSSLNVSVASGVCMFEAVRQRVK